MRRQGKSRPIVVTGGCGFIGCNLADSLLSDAENVILVDNLSRPGVEQNLSWLRQRHGSKAVAEIIDIRTADAMDSVVEGAEAVFHLAAQTAVTRSLVDPVEDFEINARGTLNVLEAARAAGDIPVIFASTNKVYGDLADIETSDADGSLYADRRLTSSPWHRGEPAARFQHALRLLQGRGRPIYPRLRQSFGMRTAVLRMSCIYGPRQFGNEDQGWVAHFLIRALARQPITIFGDGRQVRDILYVADAVAAYRALLADIDRLQGKAFNLGGGPDNAVSLNLVLEAIGSITGRQPDIRHAEPRTGDQRYFVADTSRLREATGWQPMTGWREGVEKLADWLGSQRRGDAEPERFVA